MSRPPIDPEKSLAGISVDPITLARVIPESKRSDGTVRKQIRIRPGFTPQEDIRRFRGTKQAQMDANALPKGHIIGWAQPTSSSKPAGGEPTGSSVSGKDTTPTTKAAKKNAKRKEKREKEKAEITKQDVPDNWEDEEDDVNTPAQEQEQQKEDDDAELSSKLESLKV